MYYSADVAFGSGVIEPVVGYTVVSFDFATGDWVWLQNPVPSERVYAGAVVVLTRDLVVLNTYAARGEPPTTGQFVVLLVFFSLTILWSVVILANVGGFRDWFVRRVLTQRSMFSPDPASVLTPERIKSATRSLIFVVTVVMLGEIFFLGGLLTEFM